MPTGILAASTSWSDSPSFPKWGFGNALLRAQFYCVAGGGSSARFLGQPLTAKHSFPAMRAFPKPHFGNESSELDASNNVTKRFFAQGEQIAGASYYYTRDHLGSIRELTDAAGAVRARYDYEPWGHRSANQITANPVEADFGYTGHFFDAATGMYVTYYRWYDADSARWLSPDPIGEEGGLNLYGYAQNSPIGLFDPLGLLSTA